MIIDKMMQCEIWEEHNAKGKIFLHMWINSARATSRNEGHVERNAKIGNDSLEQFAVAKRKKTVEHGEGLPRTICFSAARFQICLLQFHSVVV